MFYYLPYMVETRIKVNSGLRLLPYYLEQQSLEILFLCKNCTVCHGYFKYILRINIVSIRNNIYLVIHGVFCVKTVARIKNCATTTQFRNPLQAQALFFFPPHTFRRTPPSSLGLVSAICSDWLRVHIDNLLTNRISRTQTAVYFGIRVGKKISPGVA